MKKLIIICLLALSYTSTQAQEPTKQETMDWIVSKFKQYPNGKGVLMKQTKSASTDININSKFIEHKEGILYFEKYKESTTLMKETGNEYKKNQLEQFSINLNNVFECRTNPTGSILLLGLEILKIKTFEESEKGDFIVNGKKYNLISDSKKENSFFLKERIEHEPTFLDFNLLLFDSEPDLYNRMIKAFQTLAKFNNAERPKEKF